FFGLEAGVSHGFTAEAVADVVLTRYPRSGIERIAESDPGVARRLHHLAFESLADAHTRMLLLGRKTANERVASFLLEQSERAGDAEIIELAMSRNDIADYLGL